VVLYRNDYCITPQSYFHITPLIEAILVAAGQTCDVTNIGSDVTNNGPDVTNNGSGVAE
jgi:hypothetical protein